MKRWNETEDKALKESASTLSAQQIGCLLGRTERSVRARATIIGIGLKKVVIRTTAESIQKPILISPASCTTQE